MKHSNMQLFNLSQISNPTNSQLCNPSILAKRKKLRSIMNEIRIIMNSALSRTEILTPHHMNEKLY